MKKFLIALTFFATTFSVAVQARINDLAHRYRIIKQFDSRPIFHARSITYMGGWTCGYFCLWNAKELERHLGLSDNAMPYFKSDCLRYLGFCGKSPTAGASNEDLIYLADDYLGVHNLYPLMMHHGAIQPMIAKETTSWTLSTAAKTIHTDVKIKRHEMYIKIIAPYDTSQSVIKEAAKQAKYKKIGSFMRDLKHKIISGTMPPVAHFVCGFNNHWILVSVVTLPHEPPALFVFDNLNKHITPGSPAMHYINQIYGLFTS